MNIQIIKCDVCNAVLSSHTDGVKDGGVLNQQPTEVMMGKFKGLVCSLQCLVIKYTQVTVVNPTDSTIIDNLKKTFPDWQITSPDYSAMYQEKKLKEVKEAMQGLSGYKLVKEEKTDEANKS